MNITAETTVAAITAPVLRARLEMGNKAMEFAAESNGNPEEFFLRGEALVSLAQNVASAEALMQAQLGYLNVCQSTDDKMAKVQYLFKIVARGADDSWSGRKNDSNRSSFDAVRSWADNQADNVRYEG